MCAINAQVKVPCDSVYEDTYYEDYETKDLVHKVIDGYGYNHKWVATKKCICPFPYEYRVTVYKYIPKTFEQICKEAKEKTVAALKADIDKLTSVEELRLTKTKDRVGMQKENTDIIIGEDFGIDLYEIYVKRFLQDWNEYKAECYADSSWKPPFNYWAFVRTDTLGNGVYSGYDQLKLVEGYYIHSQPTFTDFMEFLEKKYK